MIVPLKPTTPVTLLRQPRIVTPQCCVPVAPPNHDDDWRRRRYQRLRPSMSPDLCQHESVYRINGKHYCKMHAGMVALERWTNGDLVEK